jgi:hypothetical protein
LCGGSKIVGERIGLDDRAISVRADGDVELAVQAKRHGYRLQLRVRLVGTERAGVGKIGDRDVVGVVEARVGAENDSIDPLGRRRRHLAEIGDGPADLDLIAAVRGRRHNEAARGKIGIELGGGLDRDRRRVVRGRVDAVRGLDDGGVAVDVPVRSEGDSDRAGASDSIRQLETVRARNAVAGAERPVLARVVEHHRVDQLLAHGRVGDYDAVVPTPRRGGGADIDVVPGDGQRITGLNG